LRGSERTVKVNVREEKMNDKPFQRKGAISNSHVGREFEENVKTFFATQGVQLIQSIMVPIGFHGRKTHYFDLGNYEDKILIECKAHTWTEGGNVPSAKITTWNQAMYFFHVAPRGFRRMLVVLKSFSHRRRETLAEYYIRTNWHLIPKNVEVWEYDMDNHTATRLKHRGEQAVGGDA
jgi:hypothetical protein